MSHPRVTTDPWHAPQAFEITPNSKPLDFHAFIRAQRDAYERSVLASIERVIFANYSFLPKDKP